MNETFRAALLKIQTSQEYEPLMKEFSGKNDAGKIKIAIQFLIKHSKPPKILYQQKDPNKTKDKISEANMMVASKAPLKAVLEKYTEAIAYAPKYSKELGLSYANRSAALCNASFYEDSMKDINRALQCGYPDKLKSQLYVRRAKNLLGLNPFMRPEVLDAMAKGKYFLECASEAEQARLRSVLDNLKRYPKHSFNPPYEKWNDRKFLPKTPGGNTKILRVCDGITMKYSEEFGRHIVATKEIDAGEAIVVHRAYVSTLYPEHWYSYCWHCSRRAWTAVPCAHCVHVIFCNEACRDKAWVEYHDIECSVIAVFCADPVNPCEVMTLRMTIKALKEAKTLQVLKARVTVIDSLTDPITKTYTDGMFNDRKYTSVCTLMRKTEEPKIQFQYALRCACILYYLAATTKIFGKKIYDFKIIVEDELALFLGGLIFRNLEIQTMNGIQVHTNDYDGKYLVKGGQLISFQSLFNHSCDPNAYQFISNDMNAIIALQMIKEGQQIFISYGPGYTDQPTNVRRQRLQKSHGFFCDCGACDNNWRPGIRLPCFSELHLPTLTKHLLNSIKEKNYIYRFPLSFDIIKESSVDNILRTKATLFEILNAYGRHLNIPCQEIQILKMSLTRIYNAITR